MKSTLRSGLHLVEETYSKTLLTQILLDKTAKWVGVSPISGMRTSEASALKNNSNY